jgi:hypothetical protein
MKRFRASILALAVSMVAGVVGAQSTGGFSPPSSGAAAAGSSPTGMVVPWTVQMGSTAPTQPGHTITPSGAGTYGYGSPRSEAREPDKYAFDDRSESTK